MAPPEPALPEVRERRCSACESEWVTPLGHVTSDEGLIKVTYRCEACGTVFLFVHKMLD